MKNIYSVGNLIWIKMETNYTYGSKEVRYMLCGRNGGLVLDAILSEKELLDNYPKGKFTEFINASDTCIYL